ncbi:uncharacterized protein LOC141600336 [Silene latifolia]|uniref:uncharacterized protein LOC141600336 n=1 Tax=Silene latifolia TaxID=37657 RepID=UPI003D76A8B5
MAFQTAFKERLEDMDNTRNQRLTLLQAEKDLQKNKSVVLSAKHSNISLLEQRCLILDQTFASDNLRISSLKSQIQLLHRTFQSSSKHFRDLSVQVEELEQLDRERDINYSVNSAKINKFTVETQTFASELRIQVEELRCRRNKLKLLCSELQKNNGDVQNVDIQAAEIRNSELLALKKKVVITRESNERERAELQKQLQSLR